jgi:hypothetical protein
MIVFVFTITASFKTSYRSLFVFSVADAQNTWLESIITSSPVQALRLSNRLEVYRTWLLLEQPLGTVSIFFIATTVVLLHRSRTTNSTASWVCPGCHFLSTFGKAGPWLLYVLGRWTCESVSNGVVLSWIRFF